MRRGAIILTILACLALAACGPSVNQATEAASDFCALHGGVSKMEYHHHDAFDGGNYYSAECADGSEIE